MVIDFFKGIYINMMFFERYDKWKIRSWKQLTN